MDDRPKGQLFSRVYVTRGEANGDSEQARIRLAAWLREYAPDQLRNRILTSIELNLGVSYRHFLGMKYRDAMCVLSTVEFLDSLTLIAQVLHDYDDEYGRYQSRLKEPWIEAVRDVFDAQNLHYDIDDEGGVHRTIDHAFDSQRASTIAGMESSRYAGARASLDHAYAQFAATSPNPKTALVSLFDAVENVAKLLLGCARLAPKEANQIAQMLCDRAELADYPGLTKQLGESFVKWVTAMQEVRHAPGTEHHALPDSSVALAAFSSGVAFLRWIVDLDRSGFAKASA